MASAAAELTRLLDSKSKIRRKVFNAVYGRGTRARSKRQLMEAAKIRADGTNGQQVQNELAVC
jgi:hypothetical protein